jgi:caa(3)-type oxidase subunit IV
MESSVETLAPPTRTHGPRAHPSELTYVYVALILALFTGLEVSTYFVDFGKAHIPLLLVLMVIKFGTVAAYFMHLKFDSGLFTRMFVAGVCFAVGVYIVMLSAFKFF